eukprot:8944328-Pyramimonas_sp.AAC.1
MAGEVGVLSRAREEREVAQRAARLLQREDLASTTKRNNMATFCMAASVWATAGRLSVPGSDAESFRRRP